MGGNVVTIETEIENKQIDTLLQVLFFDWVVKYTIMKSKVYDHIKYMLDVSINDLA